MTQHRRFDASELCLSELLDLIHSFDSTCNYFDCVWSNLLNPSRGNGYDHDQAFETAAWVYWEKMNEFRQKMKKLVDRYEKLSK